LTTLAVAALGGAVDAAFMPRGVGFGAGFVLFAVLTFRAVLADFAAVFFVRAPCAGLVPARFDVERFRLDAERFRLLVVFARFLPESAATRRSGDRLGERLGVRRAERLEERPEERREEGCLAMVKSSRES
jgi:hypothetical protein